MVHGLGSQIFLREFDSPGRLIILALFTAKLNLINRFSKHVISVFMLGKQIIISDFDSHCMPYALY